MTHPTPLALITGGTNGIGKAVALALAQRGHALVLVGRDESRADATRQMIQQVVPRASVTFWPYDLSLMRDAAALVQQMHATYPALDVLVHCAGVMLRNHTLTEEGLETVFAVQYLARYHLSYGLLDLLRAGNGCSINVSAGGSINMTLDFDNLNGEKSYNGVTALKHESIANDMLVIDLATQADHVRHYGYGPGYVRTNLLQDMPAALRFFANTLGRAIAISPQRAASEIIGLIESERSSGLYGRLYSRTMRHNPPAGFRADPTNRKRLREVSQRLIAQAVSDDALTTGKNTVPQA